jgi:hypothetical protein
MENFNDILWITGIWFLVWLVMYLIGEMFIDIIYFHSEKPEKLKKYTILLTITFVIFYVAQIIDYLNIFN